MRKIILISVGILMVASFGFALTVGEGTGFGYGIIVGGKTILPGGGEITATYWNTPMTDRWDVAQTALWNTPMNTEIP